MDLGLAVRTELGTTGINTNNTPTGNAMPNYTQTQTAEKIEFSISEQRERDTILRELLSITPKENSLLFESFQNKYNNEIYHHITELMLWAATTEHNQDAPLTVANYDRKISEEREKLKTMDDTLPVESYFRQGASDTAKCGHLLIIKLRVWNEDKQIYAIELLSGIQWLIRERDALSDNISFEPEVETSVSNQAVQQETERKDSKEIELDIETLALKNAFITACGLKDDEGKLKYNLGVIYYILRFLCEGKGWAKNARTFAKHMGPVFGKTPSSIQVAINREKDTFANLPLDDMESFITKFKKENPHKGTQELMKIAELYDTMKSQLKQNGVI